MSLVNHLYEGKPAKATESTLHRAGRDFYICQLATNTYIHHFAAPLIVPRQELRIMAVLSSTCDGQSVLAFEGLTTSDALSTRAIYFRVNLERILPCLLGVL